MDKDNPEEGQLSKKRQKSQEEREYEKELIAIFKEHWNHARHCEIERLYFTSIYTAVVAGILVFIGNAAYGKIPDFISASLLAFFGLILSVIGFFVVTALTLGYLHHITDIVMIFYYWDKMEFYRHPGKPALFARAHRWFFEITISLFVILLLVYLPQAGISLPHFHENPPWLIATFIGIFIVIEGLYRCEWEKYSSDCVRFKNALQNDFDGNYRKKWEKWFKDPRYVRITLNAEEIRERVIDDAEDRYILPKAKEECWLCKLPHGVLRILNTIHRGFIWLLCRR